MSNDPQGIAAQLRRPSGTGAVGAADQMNKANAAANLKAIKALEISQYDRVLEIGPGNGKFAPDVLAQARDVKYVGVDWSGEMVNAAQKLNASVVDSGAARFYAGESSDLPFEHASFDKALSVHTLYFWEDPVDHLVEIKRVLKPSGRFCLGFGDAAFMENLPFTAFGFQLYDKNMATEILGEAGFS
ncbi:MAG: class I SAM-dependent methyltransferase, partial [Pseudomonadota bacterium]